MALPGGLNLETTEPMPLFHGVVSTDIWAWFTVVLPVLHGTTRAYIWHTTYLTSSSTLKVMNAYNTELCAAGIPFTW